MPVKNNGAASASDAAPDLEQISEELEIAPTFDGKVTEREKAHWRQSCARDTAALLIDGDKSLMRQVAMALVDYKQNGGAASDNYFDDRLKDMGLENAGSLRMMRVATVATGLDRRAAEDGAKAKKLLDNLARTIEGLLIRLRQLEPMAFSYTAACVQHLVTVILETPGGLRALANLARNESIDTNERGVIALDAKKAGEIVAGRAQSKLAGSDASTFVIAVRDKTGQLVAAMDRSIDRAGAIQAIAAWDIDDGKVQALHEMQLATIAIAREATDKPKVIGQDPLSAKTEKRRTEPHIVLTPDGSVHVSAHFAPASNVIRITGLSQLVDEAPDRFIMLPPEVHTKLGKNLATATQRNVVLITEEDPAVGTMQVYRTMKLKSDAALHERYQPGGEGLSFSWRHPTYGRAGVEDAVPTVRSGLEWDRKYSLAQQGRDGFFNGVVEARQRLDRSASKRRPVLLSFSDNRFSVILGADLSFGCLVDRADKDPVQIRVAAADLRGFLLLLSQLRPGAIDLEIEKANRVLRWSFASSRANYQLFMPCAGESGTRITSAFEPLAVVPQAKASK